MPSFAVEVFWPIENPKWVPLPGEFSSGAEALWQIGLWKQANQCFGEPFRVVEIPGINPEDAKLARECVENAHREPETVYPPSAASRYAKE